jgi:hypothetical protein
VSGAPSDKPENAHVQEASPPKQTTTVDLGKDTMAAQYLQKRLGQQPAAAPGPAPASTSAAGPITINQYAAPVKTSTAKQEKDGGGLFQWLHLHKNRPRYEVKSTDAAGVSSE